MRARELPLLRHWSIRPDPGDVGLAQGWPTNPPRDGWLSCRADEPWQAALGAPRHGVCWYRRRVRLPARWIERGSRARLRFNAVATDCRVWVNAVEVGAHTGDYLPFELDITDALAGSERCEILCRVDEIEGRPPDRPGHEPWIGHITKGFHDVLSLQHGGIWDGVVARQTGTIAIEPMGLAARADPETGEVLARIALHPHEERGSVEVELVQPGDGRRHVARARIEPGQREIALAIRCSEVVRWSPDSPELGLVRARVRADGPSPGDEAHARFAFRTLRVGGPDHRHVLLNGRPTLLRGVLEWFVEPAHIAPSPTEDEIRERFRELRARGFNMVCVCMVYPPERFYDIADETGMLVWQVHPVWKSSMAPEHMAEYRRLYAGFLRRDARHPSVVLVSATCEHECFDAELGKWWWARARDALPGALLQVQTGFLGWSDFERMDLWDEHTYDNSGRWLCYLDDLERFFEGRPARPFAMGETIIGTSWPDTGAIARFLGEERPWWAPRGLDACIAFERSAEERFGSGTVTRLRADADAFNLDQRKLQCEALRAREWCAGWVMNHLRDVRVCQCGFMDDLGRWRFQPSQLRPFLGDRVALLRTPGGARGVRQGEPVACEIGVSNFAESDWAGTVRVRARLHDGENSREERVDVLLAAGVGQARFAPVSLPAARSAAPACWTISAEAPGLEPNAWRVWTFPGGEAPAPGVFRAQGAPYTDRERAPDFEERRYSSGWALECASWRPRLPDVEALLPSAPRWPDESPTPRVDRATLVATRLTPHLLTHLEHGGRVVLLASKAVGNPPTRWVNLYGQAPLIVAGAEGGVLAPSDRAWVLDTLGLDLNRWSARAVPTGELGLGDAVDPVVRLVVTHDKPAPEVHDQLFVTRVGAGVLAVSTLDHGNPAGGRLLRRMIAFVHAPDAPARVRGVLGTDLARSWCVEGEGRGILPQA